jgi:drug/metabolite transporter (DMT)-like permease
MAARGLLAPAQLALGMAVFGSATPVARIVGEAFPPFAGAAIRVVIGALVLLPFAVATLGPVKRLPARDWLVLGAVALFGMVGFSVFMVLGMRLVPGVVGSVVMSTTPAVTALAAFLFMGDRLDWRRIVAVALAVAGVVLMNTAGRDALAAGAGALLAGSALVFTAVCCETAYTLLGKVAMRRLDPLPLTFMAAALSLPAFIPLGLMDVGAINWSELTWHHWAGAIWWGAGTLGLGSILWYSGVAQVQGSTAAGFMGVMPVSALVLSYLLLGEPFRWIHLAGFTIVFAGVLLISWAHWREARQSV